MSNQKSGLRFRMPSWFAPASASSSQPPSPQKSSNQQTSTSPSTSLSNKATNNKSAAATQASSSEEVQNSDKSRTGTLPQDSPAVQKTPLKPTGKVVQNSNSHSQTSKTKPDFLPQARRTSQPGHDKPASPTKLNNQPSSSPLEASHTKTKPVQLSPTAPPQLSSTSEKPSQSLAKPEKDTDHEFNSIEEADFKSSPPINSPKAQTKLPQYEATIGSEIKSTHEVVSKPHSPKRSPQLATKDSSLLSATTKEPISATDEIAANSPDQAKVTHNEIKGQTTEQVPTGRGDSESPLPTPGSNSSDMNHEREKIPVSHLKHDVAKQVTAEDQDTTDKELENENKAINEVQWVVSGSEKLIKEQQNVAVQPIHTHSETKQNIDKSMPSSKQNRSVNKPSYKDSNDDSHQEDGGSKGEEFPINNVSKNYKPQVRGIKIPGDKGPSREERPTSVITLAGDNRGTTMEIISESSRSDHGVHIHREYNHKESLDTEEIPNKIDSDIQNHVVDHVADMHINSNLQCINNAIMLNSSITQRDPGVHVVQPHALVESNKKAHTKS